MNERQIQEQLEQLRDSLEQAKIKLVEQNEMLQQLTSPPFAYATVVAVSEWSKKNVLPDFVNSKAGRRIKLDPNVTSRGGYNVGDELTLVTKKNLNENVMRAKRHVVVGFSDGEIVTDHDGWAFVDHLEDIQEWYRIGKKAEKVRTSTAVIVVEGKFFEVILPKDRNIKPGDTVTVVTETMQIVDVASVQVGGNIAYLRRLIDETFSEVDYESSVRVVFNGRFGRKLEKGDRVVLDGTASVIVRNLGKEDERFSFAAETNIAWNDIGGLAEAKQ